MTTPIAFLAHRIPFPPNKGEKIRAHALLAHLAARRPVHVACFVDDPDDFQHVAAVEQLTGTPCLALPLSAMTKRLRAAAGLISGHALSVAVFHDERIDRWLGDLRSRHGVSQALVFSSAMAPYALRVGAEFARASVFDMVDIDSDKWGQYAATRSGLARLVYAREARRLLLIERDAALRFGATWLVSEEETRHFRELAPEAAGHVTTLTNGVDHRRFAPDPTLPSPFAADEAAIVFTGAMDYWPNVDAVGWFAEKVLPAVRARMPQARFHIVGSRPSEVVCRLAGDGVCVVGTVPDTRPYIQHAAVVVAPLRIARGLQNKVLEAMAMARPVVASPEASRALPARPGQHLLVGDGDAAFVEAVVSVLAGNHAGLGEEARRYVETAHDWTRILSRMDGTLQALAAAPDGSLFSEFAAVAP